MRRADNRPDGPGRDKMAKKKRGSGDTGSSGSTQREMLEAAFGSALEDVSHKVGELAANSETVQLFFEKLGLTKRLKSMEGAGLTVTRSVLSGWIAKQVADGKLPAALGDMIMEYAFSFSRAFVSGLPDSPGDGDLRSAFNNAMSTLKGKLKLGGSRGAVAANAVDHTISDEVAAAILEQCGGNAMTYNRVIQWWRTGIRCLGALASTDDHQAVAAHVAKDDGAFSSVFKVVEFAKAAHDARAEARDLDLEGKECDFYVARACIDIVDANTAPHNRGSRFSAGLDRMMYKVWSLGFEIATGSGGNILTNWMAPFLMRGGGLVAALALVWCFTFGTFAIAWFAAVGFWQVLLADFLALMCLLTTLFSLTLSIQIVDKALSVPATLLRMFRNLPLVPDADDEDELSWPEYMMYRFRWAAMGGLPSASVAYHMMYYLVIRDGATLYARNMIFGGIAGATIFCGIAISVLLGMEDRAENKVGMKSPKSVIYYYATRAGLPLLSVAGLYVLLVDLAKYGHLGVNSTYRVMFPLDWVVNVASQGWLQGALVLAVLGIGFAVVKTAVGSSSNVSGNLKRGFGIAGLVIPLLICAVFIDCNGKNGKKFQAQVEAPGYVTPFVPEDEELVETGGNTRRDALLDLYAE